MEKEIATKSRTYEIMDRFSLRTKKGFGQNFITEPSVVRNIADSCELTKNSCAIEIGPGIGALTEQLAMRSGHVVAFEIDERLKEVLPYSLQAYDNWEVRFKDFLEVNVKEVVDELNQTYSDILVAANLPYYITTPLLFKIFESEANINRIVVMMQKEVADRFAAKPGSKDYNALSVITQYLYDVKVVLKVSRNVFEPKPNVDSSVVRFKKKENIIPVANQQEFFNLVKACFDQRRKTLLNNYSKYVGSKEEASKQLALANIEESRRAETLTLEEFIRLYEVKNYEG